MDFSFFPRLMRFGYFKACGWLFAVWMLSSCEANPPKALLGSAQETITYQVQQAVNDFVLRHQTDTIDFSTLNQFAWDSVYIFGQYTADVNLNEGWDWIDWNAITIDGSVPEHTNRFIFIRRHQAIGYIDLSAKLIREVHYFKYFSDDRGYLHAYRGATTKSHFMPVNCFAKKEAKFILVCPTDIPQGDSTAYVFAKAAYFKDKQALLRRSMELMPLNMHPIAGCGYPNCWANTHIHRPLQ